MNKNDLILALDIGTQSIRTVLFDLEGNIEELVKTEIEPFFSTKLGFAEQSPEYFWEKLCETCRKLFSETKIKIERISCVALTTQRGTVINLDKNGKSLRPAIVWPDQRLAEVSEYPGKSMGLILKTIGLKESVIHAVKNGECNWIMQNEPEIWEKTHKFLFLSGYITFKLTDNYVDSIGSTVGYIPFDYKKHEWVSKKHKNFKMFPVEKQKLAKLVNQSEILGEITKEAAQDTGIPFGLPIFATASDKACEVLGSGVFSPDVACLSYGTTATVQTTNKKYIETIPFFPPYPGAIPEYYNTEIMIYRGFWLVSWFKKQFGFQEMEISKQTGVQPEELFDEMIKDIPPGSMGLTLQPYWSPGVKIPGTEAKGAIIGFGDVHTKAHVYRAILEGLAFALREGLARTEKRTNIKTTKIIISGGGSQSNIAVQLTADIFGKQIKKPHTFETSALGAAICAAVGMKYFPNFESAIKSMTRSGSTFYPNEKNTEIYNKLYEKVYLKMYKRLQPLYNQIREITNYPEKLK